VLKRLHADKLVKKERGGMFALTHPVGTKAAAKLPPLTVEAKGYEHP